MTCFSMKHSIVGDVAARLLSMLGASSCGFKRTKYENPITKDTQQPDKVLLRQGDQRSWRTAAMSWRA